ncbi:uncharacterized protein F4822DRAFT_426484 [Hypoxylon trugodes]|uniref:uncharacterized protein n=1 Tax=Hypoxylon trugodes TaxID=326681 RepID=UPI00218CA3BA|nr:uncharacterized protein F4822DRAFT_426484 [Hypoxylon trugodes]KAI1390636.1 hypothetical protein F4822DRAFT_426484 [Hypoxylon trugodes]
MKFRNSLLIFLSGLLSQAGTVLSEDPPLPPWYPLKPWEISSLRAHNPRNGPYGTNATGLEITISNPYYIAAGPAPHASGGGYIQFEKSVANCDVHWKVDDRTPYGHLQDTCAAEASGSTQAQWNITINEIQDIGEHYISLSFSLTYHLHAYGSDYYKMMSGSIFAQVGDNLEGGCDENDYCSYTIKNGSAPLLIQPTLQECRYACG